MRKCRIVDTTWRANMPFDDPRPLEPPTALGGEVDHLRGIAEAQAAFIEADEVERR